jgi:hypothetical protein
MIIEHTLSLRLTLCSHSLKIRPAELWWEKETEKTRGQNQRIYNSGKTSKIQETSEMLQDAIIVDCMCQQIFLQPKGEEGAQKTSACSFLSAG